MVSGKTSGLPAEDEERRNERMEKNEAKEKTPTPTPRLPSPLAGASAVTPAASADQQDGRPVEVCIFKRFDSTSSVESSGSGIDSKHESIPQSSSSIAMSSVTHSIRNIVGSTLRWDKGMQLVCFRHSIKDQLWRGFKFLQSDHELQFNRSIRTVCGFMLQTCDVKNEAEAMQIEWWNTHKKEVKPTLISYRNSVIKAIQKKYYLLLDKEGSNNSKLVTYMTGDLLKLKRQDSDAYLKLFDHFGPAVLGVMKWRELQDYQIAFSSMVSPSDEAFLILCLHSYPEKWTYDKSNATMREKSTVKRGRFPSQDKTAAQDEDGTHKDGCAGTIHKIGRNTKGPQLFRQEYQAVLENRRLHGDEFDAKFIEHMKDLAEERPRKKKRFMVDMPNELGTAIMPDSKFCVS